MCQTAFNSLNTSNERARTQVAGKKAQQLDFVEIEKEA